MKRRPSTPQKSAAVAPIAVVGTNSQAAGEVQKRIAPYWPVLLTESWSFDEDKVAGIVAVGPKVKAAKKRGGPPLLVFEEDDQRGLNAFAAYVLAKHYTQIESVAEVIRDLAHEHNLTVKQSELVIVHCLDVSRRDILARLGISENTLKTRIRLLARVFGAEQGMTEVAHRILRKAAMAPEERSRPEREPPAPPRIAERDKPAKRGPGRGSKRKKR
jgi:hypothetical protein